MKITLATLPVLVMAALSTATCSGSLFNWANPGNAQSSDASYATGGVSLGAFSNAKWDYLIAQNFGFSIPSTATICEIGVDVQRSASGLGIGGDVADQSVRLLQNGALYGNDLANPAVAWPASDGAATYGSALLASTWGGSWQAQVRVTIINDHNAILRLPFENFSAAVSPDGEGRRLSWTASAGKGAVKK